MRTWTAQRQTFSLRRLLGGRKVQIKSRQKKRRLELLRGCEARQVTVALQQGCTVRDFGKRWCEAYAGCERKLAGVVAARCHPTQPVQSSHCSRLGMYLKKLYEHCLSHTSYRKCENRVEDLILDEFPLNINNNSRCAVVAKCDICDSEAWFR